jgi:hypothetical protein
METGNSGWDPCELPRCLECKLVYFPQMAMSPHTSPLHCAAHLPSDSQWVKLCHALVLGSVLATVAVGNSTPTYNSNSFWPLLVQHSRGLIWSTERVSRKLTIDSIDSILRGVGEGGEERRAVCAGVVAVSLPSTSQLSSDLRRKHKQYCTPAKRYSNKHGSEGTVVPRPPCNISIAATV